MHHMCTNNNDRSIVVEVQEEDGVIHHDIEGYTVVVSLKDITSITS